MPGRRSDALDQLVSELESFELDMTQYYDDAEPQGVYDSVLTGRLEALAGFCERLGWSELFAAVRELIPVRSTAVEVLETLRGYVLPEVRMLMAQTGIADERDPADWFWQLVHPRIASLARERFDSGFLGDAVESCYKEVNEVMKRLVTAQTGKELDGAGLMTTALSPTNPIVALNSLRSESDRSEQQGYMQIFAGSMTGIRNPKAHGNLTPDSKRAFHLIGLASLLMYKIDERADP